MAKLEWLLMLSTLFFHAVIGHKHADTTASSLDNVTENINVNVSESVNRATADKVVKCITLSQLAAIRELVIKLAANEINKEQFQSTWDFLDNSNLYDNDVPPIEHIINYMLSNSFDEPFNAFNKFSIYFDKPFNKLLQFVNYSSNIDWKMIGYRTLFNQIVSHSSLSKVTSNWINLHYLVSHDAINATKLQVLLNEIESEFNIVLDSPQFTYVGNHFVIYSWKYVIQRLCSTDPPNIAAAYKIIFAGNYNAHALYQQMESILSCITELERNNKLNYSMAMIPWIKYNLQQPTYDQKLCQLRNELIEKFPTNSSIIKLLSGSHEFYIRNAHSNEYLRYVEIQHSWRGQQEINARIYTNPAEKSKWKIVASSGELHSNDYSFGIHNKYGNSIIARKCEYHDEYYVIMSKDFLDKKCVWSLEIDDIFSDRFRIRYYSTGEYLSVGQRNKLMFSSYYNNIVVSASEMEWIFESLPNQVDDIENENKEMCKAVQPEMLSTYSYSNNVLLEPFGRH